MNNCVKCARFPFCEEEPENCNNFKKRNYEIKLVNKDGNNFKFERVN